MPHHLRSVALTLSLVLAVFALEVGPRATAAGAVPVADRLLSIGAGAGPTYPSGDAADALDNGYNGFAFLRLNLPAFPIDPRVSLTYQKLDLADVSFASPGLAGGGSYGSGELETGSLLFEGQFAILPLGPVQTYGIAGAGWSNFKVKLEGGTTGGSVDDSVTEFTYCAGLGVSVGLGGLNCFAEGRYLQIENDGQLLALDSVGLVPVTIGIRF